MTTNNPIQQESLQEKNQWFIDSYKNDTLTYDIEKTGRRFGTICMPTGTGKSGKIFANIIANIKNHIADGWTKQLVINVNSPILNLNQQLVKDLLCVLHGIEILKDEEIGVYVNSSDEPKSYIAEGSDIAIVRISKNGFDKSHKLCIVTSCNPSLYKFYKMMEKLDRSSMEVISYLDEAHTISFYGDDETSQKFGERPNVKRLCNVCDKVYAFSATPDPDVTKVINEHETMENFEHFIILLTPKNAITKRMIIAPKFKYISEKNEAKCVTADICEKAMKNAIEELPGIKHKILVTCQDSEHLKSLRIELENRGYRVFSTCVKYLFNLVQEDNAEEAKTHNITTFTRDIEQCDDNCFVLHIRQLICGIDVKGLTDCIIYGNITGCQTDWRTYVQTIGRILRAGKGERGMNIDKATKKYGNVYFYNPSGDAEQKNKIARMFTAIYGLNTKFEDLFGHRATNSDGKSTTDDVEFAVEDNVYNTHLKSENLFIENIKIEIRNLLDFYREMNLLKILTAQDGNPIDNLKKQCLVDLEVRLGTCGISLDDEMDSVDIIGKEKIVEEILDQIVADKSYRLW